jgi:hypothetical protein
MRRTLIVLVLTAAAVFFVPAAVAAGPVVYVNNLSADVPQQDVDAALPAFQTMVSRDLAAVWGVDATLTTDPAYKDSAAMEVRLEDDADCMGCLGYHDIADRPYARVFARTSAEYNESWQLVFSHELEEMLVDPVVNRFSRWNGRNWLVEVSDPCESGMYAYFIDGVAVSDFVTPRWYDAGLRGRFDFTGRLRRAGQIGRHGYASYWDGGWQQVFGFGLPWADRN